MNTPMTPEEFTERLQAIADRANADAVKLVHEAQERAGLGISTDKPLPFADNPNTERAVDTLATVAGWVSDRLHGINRLHRKSLTKKIRRALGYTSP